MSWVLIREIPGERPENIARFRDDGKVVIMSKFVENGIQDKGIFIPAAVRGEYGGQERVRLYKDGTNEVNPFLKKAFENFYVPDVIARQGPGNVKWIRKD